MTVGAYVLVTLNPGSEKNILQKISYFEEVTKVSMTYGEYDALVQVSAENLDQSGRVLGRSQQRRMPGCMWCGRRPGRTDR